jgi:hypothetical protein
MQDVYLTIAHALARPFFSSLKQKRRCYQLWRVDFVALARLALVCREAATDVRRLLLCTLLGDRERARRAQVKRAHAFLRLPAIAPFLASASWMRECGYDDGERAHIRCVTSVAFNGRIRIQECFFPGRRMMRKSPLMKNRVGMTLTGAKRGRVLVWDSGSGRSSRRDVLTGTFTNADGALGGLRFITHLGREHWALINPAAYRRLKCYRDCMDANFKFAAIASAS